MEKQDPFGIFKKLPVWLYLLAALLLAGALFWLFHAAANIQSASKMSNSADSSGAAGAVAATTDSETSLAQSLIQSYEVNAKNINTYTSAGRRARYYSGTLLQEWNQYFDSLDSSNTWNIVSSATITGVKLVAKTDEQITALACVSEDRLQVDQKGKLVKQLGTLSFAGAYVFLKDGTDWKLAYFLEVSDVDSARKAYNDSPAELQTLAGPIGPLLQITCK